MKKLLQRLLMSVLCIQAQTSAAKDSFLDLPVDAAVKSPRASALHDLPFFMLGQSHPDFGKSLGEFTANRSTNAFGKSNEEACSVAFLSAVISLQDRAKTLGGAAVVDIKSITKHNDLVSATMYRCVAGAVVANVALTGTIVSTN
jgi:hypothetical protein